MYDDYNKDWTGESGWDGRGVPHETTVPWLDLHVINGFFYGVDDSDEHSQAHDWHPPGKAEDRIEQLFKTFTESMKAAGKEDPSFISLHSGMWDMAFFGRRDKKSDLSLAHPLSADRLRWWHYRMKSIVRKVKKEWPNTPIWMRTLHRIGDNFWASHDWSPGIHMGEGFQNFFTDVRINQIRELQVAVAQEEGIPLFDFGNIWEGYQEFQDKVHPYVFPGGPIMVQSMFHHYYMETLGRENWETPQTWIKPLGWMSPFDLEDENQNPPADSP